MSRQTELLDVALREIGRQGGFVNAIVQNGHTKIYWTVGPRKIMQVIPTTPSCNRAIKTTRAQVRRLARGVCHAFSHDI